MRMSWEVLHPQPIRSRGGQLSSSVCVFNVSEALTDRLRVHGLDPGAPLVCDARVRGQRG